MDVQSTPELTLAATAEPFEPPIYAQPVVAGGTARPPGLPSSQPRLPESPVALPSPVPTPTTSENLAPPPAVSLCSPLAEHSLSDLPEIVSNPYNPPPPGREEQHHGIDFAYYHHNGRADIRNEVVQSVLPGRVVAALSDTFPYGNVVIVGTGLEWLPPNVHAALPLADGQGEIYLLYAHLAQAPLVSPGEAVSACQALGEVGASGNAAVPHLHLETRLGPAGAVFDELDYYRTTSTEAARANYEAWRTGGAYQHFDPLRLLLSTQGD